LKAPLSFALLSLWPLYTTATPDYKTIMISINESNRFNQCQIRGHNAHPSVGKVVRQPFFTAIFSTFKLLSEPGSFATITIFTSNGVCSLMEDNKTACDNRYD
jgi:hypothetical protein